MSRRPWGVLLGCCLLAASAAQAESAIDRQQRELALLREGWYRQVPPAPVPLPMRTAGPADSGQDGVGILLRNVDMYLRGNIGFHVPELKGWLVPNRAGQPVDFDRPQDMHFQVMEGEVLLSPRQLANLFNEHILAYDGTMLKDFRMSSAAGRLEVEGRVRPLGVGPWLPLRLGGGVEVDAASGALVYRPDQLRVIGLPLYGAMSLVGLPMSALVSLDRPGASLVGSAMRLDYRKVFPLLGIDGHVQEAWLDDQGLHLRFSQAPARPAVAGVQPAGRGGPILPLATVGRPEDLRNPHHLRPGAAEDRDPGPGADLQPAGLPQGAGDRHHPGQRGWHLLHAGAAVCQSLVGRPAQLAWSPPARVFILAPLSFHDEVTPWHDRWR